MKSFKLIGLISFIVISVIVTIVFVLMVMSIIFNTAFTIEEGPDPIRAEKVYGNKLIHLYVT